MIVGLEPSQGSLKAATNFAVLNQRILSASMNNSEFIYKLKNLKAKWNRLSKLHKLGNQSDTDFENKITFQNWKPFLLSSKSRKRKAWEN